MVNIRKTSHVVSLGKAESSSSSTPADRNTEPTSPFAARPTESLKNITDRKSRPLTEEQKLAMLQRALQPFSSEARSHLPADLSDVEKKVRKKMMDEGFSEVIANEAGEEAVSVTIGTKRRRVARKTSSHRG